MIDLESPVTGPAYLCGLLLRVALAGIVAATLVFGLAEFVRSLEEVRAPPKSEVGQLLALASSANDWLSIWGLTAFKAIVALIAAPLTARRACALGMTPWIGASLAPLAFLAPGGGGSLQAEMADWQLALSPAIWILIALAALRPDPSAMPAGARFGVAFRAWDALLWLNVALVLVYFVAARLAAVELLSEGALEFFLTHAPVGKFGTLFALLSMCLLMIDRSKSLRETSRGAKPRVVALKARGT